MRCAVNLATCIVNLKYEIRASLVAWTWEGYHGMTQVNNIFKVFCIVQAQRKLQNAYAFKNFK